MSKLNIDRFVIDAVFDKLKHLERKVSMVKKKKGSKGKEYYPLEDEYPSEEKMVIKISL